jgi:RNA polymerase sigma-70 factor, ECF subfamily
MKSKNRSKKVKLDAQPLSLSDFAQTAYSELRAIAGRYFKGERTDHTLQPTALVHEVYIRLAVKGLEQYENRAHFFATAARAMRQILVEYARAHNADKRGNGTKISAHGLDAVAHDVPDYPAIDLALKRFAAHHPRQAEIAELRIFGGLSTEEVAETFDVAASTVRVYWAQARRFLEKQLQNS